MQETDLAYVAGLVDGEGHIGVRWAQQSSGRWVMQPALMVCSSDLSVLEWCAEIFEVGRIRNTLNQSELARKPQYKWHVQKIGHILRVLRLIVPYLHIKRDVADRMIEELESYHGSRSTPGYTTVIQAQRNTLKRQYTLAGQTYV